MNVTEADKQLFRIRSKIVIKLQKINHFLLYFFQYFSQQMKNYRSYIYVLTV